MQENAAVMMADTSNLPGAGAASQAEAPVEPLATPAPAPEDVTSSTSANLESAPAATVPPMVPSSLPSSDDQSADPTSSVAAPPAAKQINWIEGGHERVRGDSQTHVFLWKPDVPVEAGHETSLERIIKRAEGVRLSSYGTPLPTGHCWDSTTEQFFPLIRKTIAEQALLPQGASSLLTYFVLSSWFPDALPLAPCLTITGSAEEGDRVLQILRILSRNPLLMIGINIRSLQTIYWDPPPTLLFNEQNLTKQKATFLGCSTRRGYLQGDWSQYKDLYGSKAIYVGDEVPAGRKLQWSLQVNAASPTVARMAPPLSDSAVVELQRQLLGYRVHNLIKVENSTFDAPGLPTDIRPVANALGSCVVGSSKLQSELISLLAPQVEQQLADRSNSLEGMTLEAVLSLSHQGKTTLLAGEIAKEVNLFSKARGERREFKPENIGHTLKKVGLFTRRLGQAGKGLVLDPATVARVHQLSAAYGCVGLGEEDENLHCPLCAENKWVM